MNNIYKSFVRCKGCLTGADPGILVGVGGLLSKAWGLGTALRPPVGPGHHPGGGPGGEVPGSS